MMENGLKIKCMDLGFLNGLMVGIIKGNFKMIKDMERDKCTISMVQDIMGIGKMVNRMDMDKFIREPN